MAIWDGLSHSIASNDSVAGPVLTTVGMVGVTLWWIFRLQPMLNKLNDPPGALAAYPIHSALAVGMVGVTLWWIFRLQPMLNKLNDPPDLKDKNKNKKGFR
eukprot:g49370.t1